MEQPAPEVPTNVPIVVPSPVIEHGFPCYLRCKVLNDKQVPLVPINDPVPEILMRNNQERSARMQVVHSRQ